MGKESQKANKLFFLQLFKFHAVSVVNFIIDQSVFVLLNSVFSVAPVPSKLVSYSCGLINSFLMNRKWTFKKNYKYLSFNFLKFIIINVISLGVASFVIYILTSKLMVIPWVANILSTVFSFTINFTGNKFFVFKDER